MFPFRYILLYVIKFDKFNDYRVTVLYIGNFGLSTKFHTTGCLYLLQRDFTYILLQREVLHPGILPKSVFMENE